MASNDLVERDGIFAVGALARKAGWVMREQPRPDRGIDVLVEGMTGDLPDGRLVAMQIKSGTSYFKDPVDGGWRRYLDRDHVEYWMTHSLPVVLVLYNPDTEVAYWQVVREETLRPALTTYAIHVPETQRFDATVGDALSKIVETRLPTDAAERASTLQGRRLELDLPLMERLEDGDKLFVEVEQRLDGAPGQGLVRVVSERGNGSRQVDREWPWALLSGGAYAEQLQNLFPWADKRIDEALYRQETYPIFVTECGHWDENDGGYEFPEEFDLWFARNYADQLKPYGNNADGTLARWRLQLDLNQTGRDALSREERQLWEEVAHADAFDRFQQQQRKGGRYVGQTGEDDRGGFFENLVFESDDWGESLLLDGTVWSEPTQFAQAAEAILMHARGCEPSRALVEAFVSRFAGVFDTDDEEPGVESSVVLEWVEQMVP